MVDPGYPGRLSVEKFTNIFKNIINENKETVFVCEVESKVLGFVSGILLQDKYCAEVKGLYVRPSNQGAGIGGRLLGYIHEFFVLAGCKNIIVWTLLGAKNNLFYKVKGGVPCEHKLLQIGGKQYDGVGFVFSLGENTNL